MAIKRAAGASPASCKHEYSKKNGNGDGVVMSAFPLRGDRRVGLDTFFDLRKDQGVVVASPKSVGLASPLG